MNQRLMTMVGLLVATLALAGCKSDCKRLCEKLDECNLLVGDTVDGCTDDCEQDVDSGDVDEDDVKDCAECFDDNECSELGDCEDECS